MATTRSVPIRDLTRQIRDPLEPTGLAWAWAKKFQKNPWTRPDPLNPCKPAPDPSREPVQTRPIPGKPEKIKKNQKMREN
jgi:hypothetical protein